MEGKVTKIGKTKILKLEREKARSPKSLDLHLALVERMARRYLFREKP